MSTAHNIINVNKDVTTCLNISLAETTIETLKAQNHHLNVTGLNFVSLHTLFQDIYEDHFRAQDDFAERLRSLGQKIDGRYSESLKISAIKERSGSLLL